ncbi:phospholipid carrier-dependent glycosyltransferase, partial [bacterium]|nr:phospholipid carrier-dependent glycosyltransferase [bacterium]
MCHPCRQDITSGGAGVDSAFGKAWTVLSLIVFLLVLIPGIDHGLWRPDEPRVAGTCAEMARTGDYVVPHLNGVPFLEKPPLYYAAAAVSGSFLGIDSDVPYRLVSLLFSLLTVITLYAAVTRREGKTTGLMAAGILSSTWGFFMLARWVQVDMALVFGFTLAMYAYLKADDGLKATDAMFFG